MPRTRIKELPLAAGRGWWINFSQGKDRDVQGGALPDHPGGKSPVPDNIPLDGGVNAGMVQKEPRRKAVGMVDGLKKPGGCQTPAGQKKGWQ